MGPPGNLPTAFAAPPTPTPPPPPATSDTRRLLVGLGAVVVLLGLIVGLFVVPVVSSHDDGSGDESTALDDDPGTTATTTPDAPTEAELEEAVAEASAFVEEERGLTFKEDVSVELLADDAFTERLLEDFDEEAEAELAEAQVLYEALGIIEPGTDLAEVLREALGFGVIGFYDPEQGNLVVRGAALSPMARATLVHELTHALDDQHFELDRPQYDEPETGDSDGDGQPDELGFGFSALAEGNADSVEQAYTDGFSDEEQEQYDDEQSALGDELPDVPEFLLQELSLPYVFGPDLVAALYDEGGQERLDAAFAAPPKTSEGVIHPEKYLADEAIVDVPQPEADPGGEVVWTDETLGEVHTFLFLLSELDPETAREAAAGWGGDRVVAWRDADDRACVRETVVGDSAAETEELHEAWTEWAEANDAIEATVDPLAGDAPFTVTSCSATAGGSGGSNA